MCNSFCKDRCKRNNNSEIIKVHTIGTDDVVDATHKLYGIVCVLIYVIIWFRLSVCMYVCMSVRMSECCSLIAPKLMKIFSKFKRHMIRFVREQGTAALILKIYFRFGRENSKWPPKTGFSSIKRELIEIFSKFKRHMIRFDGSDQQKILVKKIYFLFSCKNSKLSPKTVFLPIT